MKTLMRKMVWVAIMAFAGLTLLVINGVQQRGSATITGFAVGICAISIVKFIQFYRISRHPEQLKKFEILQKEERFILIAEKSGRYTFVFTVVIEFMAIFVLLINGHDTLASVIGLFASIQALVYLLSYRYLSKKY